MLFSEKLFCVLHVSENVIIYTCHWFIGPSRNKPFGSEFSDSNRKSGKVDYVTDNIVGHWPVFTVLLSSRLLPIYLAALTLLNIIGLCRVSSPGGIMARGTEETRRLPAWPHIMYHSQQHGLLNVIILCSSIDINAQTGLTQPYRTRNHTLNTDKGISRHIHLFVY